LDLQEYIPPTPRLPLNRFHTPLNIYQHAVIPLMPRSDRPLDDKTRLAWSSSIDPTSDPEIAQLDWSPFNVGLQCGTPSNVTVLEVKSQGAQDWLDMEGMLPETPMWVTRLARYYLFKYLQTEQPTTELYWGVNLLNDGTIVTYPGSMYEDGRIVCWEESPDFTEPAGLPRLLLPGKGLLSPVQ
jgi:hypothetical protein